nr:MAG: coat protein [Crogonang virus 158]
MVKSRRRNKAREGGRTKATSKSSTRVEEPQAAGVVMRQRNAKMRSFGDSLVVEHAEIAAEIDTSSVFSVSSMNIIPTMFSWLEKLSNNYARYRWLRFRAFYIPGCSTSLSGVFAQAIRYDQLQDLPTLIDGLSSCSSFVTGPVWSGSEGSILLNGPNVMKPPGCICVELDTTRFPLSWYPTRLGKDVGIYVPASLLFATASGPKEAVSCGTIYVSYIIELNEPYDPTAIGLRKDTRRPFRSMSPLIKDTGRENPVDDDVGDPETASGFHMVSRIQSS